MGQAGVLTVLFVILEQRERENRSGWSNSNDRQTKANRGTLIIREKGWYTKYDASPPVVPW